MSLLLPIAPSCPALKRHSPCEESSERWWGPCEEAFESSWVLTTNFRTRHHVGIPSTRGIPSGYPGSPRVILLDFGVPMILDSPRGRPGPRGTIFEFFRFPFFFFLFQGREPESEHSHRRTRPRHPQARVSLSNRHQTEDPGPHHSSFKFSS